MARLTFQSVTQPNSHQQTCSVYVLAMHGEVIRRKECEWSALSWSAELSARTGIQIPV